MLDAVYCFVVDEGHIVVPAVLLTCWYGTMVGVMLTAPDATSV